MKIITTPESEAIGHLLHPILFFHTHQINANVSLFDNKNNRSSHQIRTKVADVHVDEFPGVHTLYCRQAGAHNS